MHDLPKLVDAGIEACGDGGGVAVMSPCKKEGSAVFKRSLEWNVQRKRFLVMLDCSHT